MNKKALWITAGVVAAVAVVGGSAVAVAAASDRGVAVASTSDSPSGAADPSASPSTSIAPSGAVDDLARAAEAALAEVGPGQVVDIDRDDDSTHAYEVDIVLDAGGSVEVRLDRAFAVVDVRRDDDGRSTTPVPVPSPSDVAASGDAERAAQAALAAVGQGRVTEVKRDDDPGIAWEVEIELPDGEDVDVELDDDFRAVEIS